MISPLKIKLTFGLILLLSIAIGLLAYKNQGLNGNNKLLKTNLSTAKTKIKSQQSTISTLEQTQRENEISHSELLEKISKAKNLASKHEQTIRTLEQQNEELKKWSNTRLPAPIIIMRQRPAISGSDAYRDWLSKRDEMSATSHEPTNKR